MEKKILRNVSCLRKIFEILFGEKMIVKEEVVKEIQLEQN